MITLSRRQSGDADRVTAREARIAELQDYIARAEARIAEVDAQCGGHAHLLHQDGIANTAIMEAQHHEARIAEARGELATIDDEVYCHGCGDTIYSADAHWHSGEPYCEGCERAPAED